MSEPIAKFTNPETGMESYVYPSTKGGFNVTLRDLDSGLFVSGTPVNIPLLQTALDKARKAAGL